MKTWDYNRKILGTFIVPFFSLIEKENKRKEKKQRQKEHKYVQYSSACGCPSIFQAQM